MSKKLLLAASLAASSVFLPAPVALAQTEAGALSPAAQRFGTLFVPTELSIETAVAGFNKEFEPAMRADANVVALDQRFPGLIEVAGNAGRSTMERVLRARIPETQRRVGALAATRLSPAELDVTNAYLGSPAGQRLQRIMAETADGSALTQTIRDTGEIPQMDGKQVMAMVNPAALSRLSKEDLSALIQFSASPAGRKFDAAGGPFAELVASEMNVMIEAMKPEIEQAVTTAIMAHLGRK